VVPLSNLLVVLGLGLVLAGGLVAPLMKLFAVCIKLALNVMVGATYVLAQCPGAYFYIKNITLGMIIGYYIVVTAGCALIWHFSKRKRILIG